jgi:hypothetical protein
MAACLVDLCITDTTFKKRKIGRIWKKMEIQASALPLSAEIQIVSAYLLVFLSCQIMLIFVTQWRKNPGSNASWIRIFMICTGELFVSYTLELLAIVFIENVVLQQFYIRGMNLVVFDVESVLLFLALRFFGSKQKKKIIIVSSFLAVLYILILAVHLVELVSMGQINIFPTAASTASLLPAILVPLGVIAFLLRRAELAFNRYYRAILLAIVVLGAGEVLRLATLQRVLFIVNVPDILWIASSVVLRIPGTTLFFLAFYFMPYIEDLNWQQNLLSLYVLETKSKAILFKELFAENIGIESRYAGNTEQDHMLLSSFSGLDDFISEVIKSPAGNLEFIDKGGIKFLFTHRKNLLFVATSKKNRQEIKAKLADFRDWFFIHFGELAKSDVLDPQQYVNAHEIVSDIFRRTKS